MGNAAIYWYPTSKANLHVIDVGESFSDVQPEQMDDGTGTRSAGGREFSTSWGGYWRVRFVIENIEMSSRAALIRDLSTLERHLRSGGSIGICNDAAKAYAAFMRGRVLEGQTNLTTNGDPFYGQGGTLAAGDQVWIESALPTSYKELALLSTAVGNKFALTDGSSYEHVDLPVMIRHDNFYPVMRLAREARGRQILTHDHGIAYTWDALLVEDTAGLYAFAGRGGVSLKPEAGGKGDTLESALIGSSDVITSQITGAIITSNKR